MAEFKWIIDLLFLLKSSENLLKVNNEDTRTTRRSGVFIVNFKQPFWWFQEE